MTKPELIELSNANTEVWVPGLTGPYTVRLDFCANSWDSNPGYLWGRDPYGSIVGSFAYEDICTSKRACWDRMMVLANDSVTEARLALKEANDQLLRVAARRSLNP